MKNTRTKNAKFRSNFIAFGKMASLNSIFRNDHEENHVFTIMYHLKKLKQI